MFYLTSNKISIRNNSRINVCGLTGSENVSATEAKPLTPDTWSINYCVNQNRSKL